MQMQMATTQAICSRRGRSPRRYRTASPAAFSINAEDIPDFYNRLIPRQGLETTCVEEVRTYDVSEYWKELV
jgi:hypothetical protein